jgi:hypothetical protein
VCRRAARGPTQPGCFFDAYTGGGCPLVVVMAVTPVKTGPFIKVGLL